MSHPDNVLKVLKSMGDSWYTTDEITAALGDYWTHQRLHLYHPNAYTNQALQNLKRRGDVESKTLPYCRFTYWRVLE